MATITESKMAEGPVNLETLKGKCSPIIESIAPSTINWDNLVGSGTYGLILGTIVEPHKWVVKVADKTTSCTTMNHEINLHKSAIDALQTFKKAQGDLPVFCPGIANFAHQDKCCWYYMQKIFKPPGLGKLLHTTIEDADPEEKKETRVKWSGIYPNPSDLSKFLRSFVERKISSIENIQYVANLNGIIFGILHFISKQTGQDLEIVLGKIGKNSPITVIFYDFDKSAFWSKSEDSQYIIRDRSLSEKDFIKVLSTSMGGSYATTMGETGAAFQEGYQRVAALTGFSDIASKALNKIKKLEEMLLGGRRRKKRRRRKSRKKKRKTKKKKRRKKRKTKRRRRRRR